MRQYLENGKRYVQSSKLLLVTNSKLYALSIGTQIDDLGWPWTP